jgi:hypothetical protein
MAASLNGYRDQVGVQSKEGQDEEDYRRDIFTDTVKFQEHSYEQRLVM